MNFKTTTIAEILAYFRSLTPKELRESYNRNYRLKKRKRNILEEAPESYFETPKRWERYTAEKWKEDIYLGENFTIEDLEEIIKKENNAYML